MTRVDIDHPPSFKEGVRVLLLMLRAKDGGHARTDRKAFIKITTTCPEEFDEALDDLRKKHSGLERIYSTINPRSIEKAIRIFKQRQLDADYFGNEDRVGFYLDLDNRWISCLKDSKASASQLFLVDIDLDQTDEIRGDDMRDEIEAAQLVIVDDYPTKNGQHIILEPFNPSLVTFPVMKNSLMLWSYGDDM